MEQWGRSPQNPWTSATWLGENYSYYRGTNNRIMLPPARYEMRSACFSVHVVTGPLTPAAALGTQARGLLEGGLRLERELV